MSRPEPPPRAISSTEHAAIRDIHDVIKPNLVTIRDQCEGISQLQRTFRRAQHAIEHANRRINGDVRAMPRDDLAGKLNKCKAELEAFTTAQYQPVAASQLYVAKEQTLPGSHAQISKEVMDLAMNLLYNFQTTVNPIQMSEWHGAKVGKLLQAIHNDEAVPHAAVYEAYRHREDPRRLLQALVAYVDKIKDQKPAAHLP
ncbi:hypothetical protein [Xanthomonas graminis]|uniref:hypothetical protein n=1 Tax=Xanthomonas graminis TaxID=3390026 RepID=UPI001F28DAF2|nr:hypothetical protein [Xanthomonas translucens]